MKCEVLRLLLCSAFFSFFLVPLFHKMSYYCIRLVTLACFFWNLLWCFSKYLPNSWEPSSMFLTDLPSCKMGGARTSILQTGELMYAVLPNCWSAWTQVVKCEAVSTFLAHKKNLLLRSSWLCLLTALILEKTIVGLCNPASLLVSL